MSDSATTLLHSGMLKYILCRTSSDNRESFGEGQRAWSAISGTAGFCGQSGGWAQQDPNLAVILGLWEDESSIENFMANKHDECFEKSGQQTCIQQIKVSRWARLNEADDGINGLETCNLNEGILRIASCELLEGENRRAHFIQSQQDIWNPAMKGAGVKGTATWTSTESPQHILVTSLWASEEHLNSWLKGPFMNAWRKADVEHDCKSVTGKVIHLEPEWCVK